MSENIGSMSRWRQLAADCKLVGEALQPAAIILGGLAALLTYMHSVSNDKQLRLQALDQAQQAQQRDTELRERELSKAFFEKQLDLYLEASRVAVRLGAGPKDPDREKTIARFWELYWGELAFVESRDVAARMIEICEKFVSVEDPKKCHNMRESEFGAAIDFAHQGQDEIRARWADKAGLLRPR